MEKMGLLNKLSFEKLNGRMNKYVIKLTKYKINFHLLFIISFKNTQPLVDK